MIVYILLNISARICITICLEKMNSLIFYLQTLRRVAGFLRKYFLMSYKGQKMPASIVLKSVLMEQGHCEYLQI